MYIPLVGYKRINIQHSPMGLLGCLSSHIQCALVRLLFTIHDKLNKQEGRWENQITNWPAFTVGSLCKAWADALIKADMNPSLTPCFLKNASLCFFRISETWLEERKEQTSKRMETNIKHCFQTTWKVKSYWWRHCKSKMGIYSLLSCCLVIFQYGEKRYRLIINWWHLFGTAAAIENMPSNLISTSLNVVNMA